MQDYYEILAINQNANEEQIKIAYKKLILLTHPDKQGGNKEKFQKVQEAYEILSDPVKRKTYDFQRNVPSFPTQNFQFPFPFNVNINFSAKPPENTNNKKKMRDEIYTLNVSLNEVKTGFIRTFNIKRTTSCPKCKIFCTFCEGSGIGKNIPQVQLGPYMNFEINCNQCNSKGYYFQTDGNCNMCYKSTQINNEVSFEIKYEKGCITGQKNVFEGWGIQAEKSNEISGDMIIILNIEKHPLFERVDILDLKYEAEISVYEAIAGSKIIIPFFDEPFEYDISEFCTINPNEEYIIPKKGLTDSVGITGNLILTFKIRYSNILLTKEEKQVIHDTFVKLNLMK